MEIRSYNRALIWVQGESDAANEKLADKYYNRLRLIIDDFRINVAKDNKLPIMVILGVDEQHPWVKKCPQVVNAQKILSREEKNVIFTSMIGREKADYTHLTPRGIWKHGLRLFAAYMRLAKKSM